MKTLLLLAVILVTVETAKPNIVIMFMDDMGWGDIGVHGKNIYPHSGYNFRPF